MPLNPQSQAFLEQMAAMGGPQLHELLPADARQAALGLLNFALPEQPVARLEDRTVPGPESELPVRVYTPSLDGPLPALVYFHGGGWVIGNLDSHDRECRALANLSGCTVIAVDYRLSPEHRFPAAIEDGYAATCYIARHAPQFGADPRRIAVGGDSAGANMATVAALLARERGGPQLAYQLLVYPVVDWDLAEPSVREFADGYFLTRTMMDYFGDLYFGPGADRTELRAAPLKADLRGLPPAMVITAEFDPLRDQGEAYAAKLRAAGVPVIQKRYDGVFHPFFSLGGVIDTARECYRDAAAALRQALL